MENPEDILKNKAPIHYSWTPEHEGPNSELDASFYESHGEPPAGCSILYTHNLDQEYLV